MLGPVEIVDEIDSTNAELVRRAAAGGIDGSVLVARHQTAGRGRRDRRWEAPAGASLLVSVLLRPRLALDELHLVTHAAGLAAVEAAAAHGAQAVSLKWPNDVVVDDDGVTRKLAGLLAESVPGGDGARAVVVGMGMNVNWEGDPPAGGVALNRLVGGAVDLDALLQRWLTGLQRRTELLQTSLGRERVRREYRSTCSTIGRSVRVDTEGASDRGVATDVDARGHLVLDGARAHAVGDVVHVRAVSPT